MPEAGAGREPAPVPAARGLAGRRPCLLGRRRPGRAICCSTMARRRISSPAACASIAAGYGRWLAWLAATAGSTADEPPPRPGSPAKRVAAYVAALRRLNAPRTVLGRIADLATVLGWFAPERDWGWLRPRSWPGCVAGFGRYRDKRTRLRSAHELLALGRRLMDRRGRRRPRPSPRERARLYRDGLMIALLAAPPAAAGQPCPARARPGAGAARRWLVARDRGRRDQDRRTDRAALPRGAGAGVGVLSRHLAAAAGPRRAAPGGNPALWPTHRGTGTQRQPCLQHHRRPHPGGLRPAGQPASVPRCRRHHHRPRPPRHRSGIAARLLGHRSFATTERYYNLARGNQAATAWHDRACQHWRQGMRGSP